MEPAEGCTTSATELVIPPSIPGPAPLPPQPTVSTSSDMVSRTPSPAPIIRSYPVPETPSFPPGTSFRLTGKPLTTANQQWILTPPPDMEEFMEGYEGVRGRDPRDMRRRAAISRSRVRRYRCGDQLCQTYHPRAEQPLGAGLFPRTIQQLLPLSPLRLAEEAFILPPPCLHMVLILQHKPDPPVLVKQAQDSPLASEQQLLAVAEESEPARGLCHA
eukprot:5190945-Amphidinium_carterae.5